MLQLALQPIQALAELHGKPMASAVMWPGRQIMIGSSALHWGLAIRKFCQQILLLSLGCLFPCSQDEHNQQKC